MILLDIMLEAYEAHQIEQFARKKDEKPFLEEMEKKAEKWNRCKEKYQNKEGLTREDLSFLFNEIPYLYDKSLVNSKPYLKEHFKRIEEENEYVHALGLFRAVIVKYFHVVDYISSQQLGIFNKKKVINSCIEKAKEVLMETNEQTVILEAYMSGGHLFEEEEEVEVTCHEKKQKMEKEFSLGDDDIEWLLGNSCISINEQITSGEQYFSHHFDRVSRREFFQKRLRHFKKVFRHYKKAFEEISCKKVYLLDREYLFERIQKLSRVSIQDCYNEYNYVRRYIKESSEE